MIIPVSHGNIDNCKVSVLSKKLMVLKIIFLLMLKVGSYSMSRGCFPRSIRDLKHQKLSNTRSKVALLMAVRDGKKKRSKKSGNAESKSSSTSPASSSNPSQHPPQQLPPKRVNSNINIPVRQQIEWARAKKEAIRMNGASFRANNVKTAYRKKLDPLIEEEKKLERAKRGQEPDWDVILNVTASAPLLIVDAYNVIYQWPRLKKWMLKGDTFKARNLLVQDLEALSSVKGWRIEVVFDGAGRSTTGPLESSRVNDPETKKVSLLDQQAKVSVTDYGVRVVYSGVGCSADSYIEKRCLDAKTVTDGKISGALIVASNDNMVRLAGQNAGALCMSSDRFITELKALKNIVAYRVESAVALFNGHEVRDPKFWGSPNLYGRRTQFLVEDKRKIQQSEMNQLKEDPESLNQHNATPLNTIQLPYGRRAQFIIMDKRKKPKTNSDRSTDF